MVAYSFKAQFEAPILAGTKRQTIRSDRKRHARNGEEIQLYFGMRTRACRLIARATCVGAVPITLDFKRRGIVVGNFTIQENDLFAREDGFADWDAMCAFWRQNHDLPTGAWSGVLIIWDALQLPAQREAA